MLDVQTEVEPKLIDIAVRNLIESPAFRSSKQCQLLLRYIVEKSLAQQDDLLRERVIGAEVFGRAPDYDTGNDPIVRARVGEVRKRLAQYYQEHRDRTGMTISVPSGSYKALFSLEEVAGLPEKLESETIQAGYTPVATDPSVITQDHRVTLPTEGVTPEAKRKFGWRIAVLSLLLLALFMSAAIGLRHHQEEQSNDLANLFWRPLIGGAKPPIIYIGKNYFYRLSGSFLRDYRKSHHLEDTVPEVPFALNDSDVISGKDLTLTHSYTGYGDVAATARIVSALTKFGSKYDLRYDDDITVSDLQATPTIFLGGYSNIWTIQLTHDFRYTLGHGGTIIDRDDKTKIWHVDPQNDYAIISRFNARTSGFVLSVAGVGPSANQAAADLISDPDRLSKVLRQAPSSWDHKNMQMVLHTSVLNHVPVSEDIQAIYVW